MKYLEIDLYKLENHPVGERLRMVFLSISNEYFVSCGKKSRKISDSFFFCAICRSVAVPADHDSCDLNKKAV